MRQRNILAAAATVAWRRKLHPHVAAKLHGIRETEVSCLRLERSAAVPGFEMPTRF